MIDMGRDIVREHLEVSGDIFTPRACASGKVIGRVVVVVVSTKIAISRDVDI